MCGITGILKFNSKINKKDLAAMTQEIAHRGPDDEGFFIEEKIGLGHRRLAILDLSKAGHQPMAYGKDLVIVFNGEIYNYLEIRNELKAQGYKFSSESDTEVIMAAYKKWGERCLERFNGMWAFIVYDRKKKTVFIARDRIGVKPLYYLQDKEKILIASEIKAILKYPGVKPQPNDKIIWQYLVSGWLDHSEETFFTGIKELRGGHFLTVNLKSQKSNFKIKRYWDLKLKKENLSETEKNNQFQNLFFDSINLRLRSDVPIGTCLSGGLDSSAIVSVVNRFLLKENISQIGERQKTFSAIYPKSYTEYDESKFIKEVISKTRAKAYFVKPSPETLIKEIKKLVYYQDQPFATTSIYAQYNVFRLAAKSKMKVMLDGQGADELLAGYTGYFGLYFIDLLKRGKILSFFKEVYLFARLHPPFWRTLKEIFFRGIKAGWLGKNLSRYLQENNKSFSVFDRQFLNRYEMPKKTGKKWGYFQDALYTSLAMNISPLLRYEDRNSMAFAIESRVPFLDYRLVEFIFSLPAEDKIRNGQTKWIMRQALKGVLPDKIRTRQDKIGFATPENDWIRKNLQEEFTSCFNSRRFKNRPYFNPVEVNKLFRNYLNGKFHDGQLFWRIYNLETWLRVFIDKPLT